MVYPACTAHPDQEMLDGTKTIAQKQLSSICVLLLAAHALKYAPKDSWPCSARQQLVIGDSMRLSRWWWCSITEHGINKFPCFGQNLRSTLSTWTSSLYSPDKKIKHNLTNQNIIEFGWKCSYAENKQKLSSFDDFPLNIWDVYRNIQLPR